MDAKKKMKAVLVDRMFMYILLLSDKNSQQYYVDSGIRKVRLWVIVPRGTRKGILRNFDDDVIEFCYPKGSKDEVSYIPPQKVERDDDNQRVVQGPWGETREEAWKNWERTKYYRPIPKRPMVTMFMPLIFCG